uniref:Uncharacterized protein n=1 Tax=Vitis vinifera TaxID=29760 RepID=A5BLN9_VITVI|nr:hypothetical protein VITISV_014906 [Vitis vinifera]
MAACIAWEMSVYVGKDDLGENVMMNGTEMGAERLMRNGYRNDDQRERGMGMTDGSVDWRCVGVWLAVDDEREDMGTMMDNWWVKRWVWWA